MNMLPLARVSVAVLLLTCLPALRADDPVALPGKKSFHLYLLIGQSNMAGRGELDEEAGTVHPRVLMFTKEERWAPAVDPLHFDRPIAGVGLGSSFGRAMAEAEPGAIIGLVPCAVGGTPLSRWQKGGDLYQQTLTRIRAAMSDGVLKGVLWHQGETDAADAKLAATYAKRLAAMIADLRIDLAAQELPFVVGKLGEFSLPEKKGKPYYWKAINGQIASLPQLAPRVAVVESAGLAHRGDFVHFDTPSLRILGQRYVDAMRALQSEKPASKASTPSAKVSMESFLYRVSEFDTIPGTKDT